jgi:bacterioferritin-associated ferredoxin
MYVCLCHGVTEKHLESLISNGCHALPEIQKCTGAGSDCGFCISSIKKHLSSKCRQTDELNTKRSA